MNYLLAINHLKPDPRETEGDLTQYYHYDKEPYTNRKFEDQWTTQKRRQTQRLRTHLG